MTDDKAEIISLVRSGDNRFGPLTVLVLLKRSSRIRIYNFIRLLATSGLTCSNVSIGSLRDSNISRAERSDNASAERLRS